MMFRILRLSVVMLSSLGGSVLYAQEPPADSALLNAVVVNQLSEVNRETTPVLVNGETPLNPVVVPSLIEPKTIPEIPPVVAAPIPTAVPTDHSAFNRFKSLAGRWEGTTQGPNKNAEDKIVVTYEITAGGNAVMERLFPGTNQEMVTMYYENKGRVYLTSYGILGNRPVMELLPYQGNVFDFALVSNPDIDPKVDTHLHSLKVVFVDKNSMKQEWKMFEAGKEVGSYSFQLTRVASNS